MKKDIRFSNVCFCFEEEDRLDSEAFKTALAKIAKESMGCKMFKFIKTVETRRNTNRKALEEVFAINQN